ncbi:hypothetical protein C1I58_13510 [Bacillus sp. PIC28]|nr:hypothetical protein C1I58_13510 [Bacillus sp. PIC28]
MEKQWWKESVVYQIYPRSFMDSNGDGIGDLQGIISKLDYLKELGIDVIWLSPVYESPNDDNGYDISDYCKIMNEFGTMEDWDELLHEMHERNMKLMMDLVVNHTSDEHNWFIESRKSKDNKYRDYYIWRPGKEGKEPNNWGAAFSGSAWQYDEMTDEYYLHLFSKKQPDLNWDNEKVRQDVYEMMKFWLEKGIDGFRMDVINFISKEEEIGMTNVRFESIDEYRDIETLNMYKEKVIDHGEDIEKVMESIYIKGRDNARTPMQWNDQNHAGFTKGEPWITVNPNYKEINVKQAIQDEGSIFYYYKKLIELRKNNEIVVYGSYDLILNNDPSIFAYVRTYGDEKLLVIANFTADESVFEMPKDISYSESELFIHNYDVEIGSIDNIPLRPYEAIVFKLK